MIIGPIIVALLVVLVCWLLGREPKPRRQENERLSSGWREQMLRHEQEQARRGHTL